MPGKLQFCLMYVSENRFLSLLCDHVAGSGNNSSSGSNDAHVKGLGSSGDFFGTRQSGKTLTDIKNLKYSTSVIFMAKKLSDEAFESRFDTENLRKEAMRKYDKLKDVVLN